MDYYKNFEILKHVRIGLEAEFYPRLSYKKLAHEFSNVLNPIRIVPLTRYHDTRLTLDSQLGKLEPDTSGGATMVELVLHHYDYYTFKTILSKVLLLIREYGYTNSSCAIQFNVSFDNLDIQKINPYALILRLDEDAIWDKFPHRKGNIYCKTIKRLMPDKDMQLLNIDNISSVLPFVQYPIGKYYGVNFEKLNKNYLEYRYLGGAKYETKINDILPLVESFIQTLYSSITEPLTESEYDRLAYIINSKTRLMRNISNIDYFFSINPYVNLQIDTVSHRQIILSYWPTILPHLIQILENIRKPEILNINWNTTSNTIEIFNSEIYVSGMLENVNFAYSTIHGGILHDCDIFQCEVYKSDLKKTTLLQTDAVKTRLINCMTNKNSQLTDCWVKGGTMNGVMKRGIFRSGKAGPHAEFIDVNKVNLKKYFQLGIQTDKK